MLIQKKRRPIKANEEMMGEVAVAPEATDLLFEAEDVAELVAEVTGQDVEVVADADTVVFTIGEEEFTVEAEGDEEILESVRKNFRNKRPVAAARKANVIRKSPRKK